MSRKGEKEKSIVPKVILFIILFLLVRSCLFSNSKEVKKNNSKTFTILSSYENKSMEDEIKKVAKEKKINVNFVYKGDLDIVSELNYSKEDYDAVWISNSMWFYMLDNPYLPTDSKSVSISPVVIGIKKSKAESLNLSNDNFTNEILLDLIKNKKISYVMNSVTSTNTGATAYFGLLNSLAGNPEVLTKEIIDDESLQNNLKDIFSGVSRVSGDEEYLSTMFINSDTYEAIIADESTLININKELNRLGKEELILFYPKDGVPICDSAFAYINNGYDKEEKFLELQSYLLSEEGQKSLEKSGKRTWYGGVSNNADKSIFNPKWGIDTTKYLNVTKFPSKDVMSYALNVYIEMLRKPNHSVFVLDYSGSMYGDGIEELKSAMEYILNYESASKDKLQFTEKDKITIIPFSSYVIDIFSTNNGKDTKDLLEKINSIDPGGNTALYDGIEEALKILSKEDESYTTTVIAMTDGAVNVGSFYDLKSYYKKLNLNIPVYGITFGNAVEYELENIADLTNAKVFNGKEGLLKAFKEVRGYN